MLYHIDKILLVFISIVILFLVSKISYKYKIYDIPEGRKKHHKPTVYTGGVALGIIYLIIILITDFEDNYLNILLTSTTLITITGLLDDKYNLNIGGKISLQIISGLVLFFQTQYFLLDLGEYELIGKIEIGSFYLIFNIFAILLIINATNYLDGIDGCLTIIYISNLILLTFVSSYFGNYDITEFIILLIIPALVFLFFNFSILGIPKMFLGDSGSLTFGYLLGFISIYIYKNSNIHPMMIAWVLGFIVFEFLSVNFTRVYLNKKLFNPGFDHIHFILQDKIKNIGLTNFIIFLINLIISIFGILLTKFSPLISLIIYLAVFIVSLIIRIKFLRKRLDFFI